ncbi:MAG: Crp/Fnr family transcriptional regulator [Pseudomonadota bacterium]
MENILFLDRLDDEASAHLNNTMVTKRYSRDEIIIGQNEDSSDVFFVVEGAARVTIFSEEGKVVAYRDLVAGDIFGEYAAIDGRPRSASVVAAGDLKVGRLTVSQFREMVETHPPFTWALLSHLSHQSRNMTERIFEFSTMLVRDRLISELIRQAELSGVEEGSAILSPAPTHFDLASKISTHREAVSREMSRLSKLKLITKHGGNLILHDLEKLSALR